MKQYIFIFVIFTSLITNVIGKEPPGWKFGHSPEYWESIVNRIKSLEKEHSKLMMEKGNEECERVLISYNKGGYRSEKAYFIGGRLFYKSYKMNGTFDYQLLLRNGTMKNSSEYEWLPGSEEQRLLEYYNGKQ